MRAIILHHIESMWDSALNKRGTSFEEMSEKVYNYLDCNGYDYVILTRFEDFEREDFCIFNRFVNVVHPYAYGWDEEYHIDDPENYCEGGIHSGSVLIEDWMRELSTHYKEVDICGAFDGECIEDLEIALDYCKVNFKRIESLIV